MSAHRQSSRLVSTLRHQGSPPTAPSGWSVSPHSPRPHCLLLLRASLGLTPSARDLLLRLLLPTALYAWLRVARFVAAGGGFYALLATTTEKEGGCGRLDPRRRPCLTILLFRASLAMPPRPPCCYPFAWLGLLGREERWGRLGSKRKSCQTGGSAS